MKIFGCCFVGPPLRDLSFQEDTPACLRLKEALLRETVYLIEVHRVRCFLTGMALGVDQWAAEAVLELKGLYPDLQLHAALPCADQAARWSAARQRRYEAILAHCDQTVTLRERYTAACMQARNQYMIEHSRFVLAVWDGQPGNTQETVAYALQEGLQVLLLHPDQPPAPEACSSYKAARPRGSASSLDTRC